VAETVTSNTSEWGLDTAAVLTGRTSLEADNAAAGLLDPAAFLTRAKTAVQASASGLKATLDTAVHAVSGLSRCEMSVTGAPLAVTGGMVSLRVPGAAGGITDMHFVPADVRRTTPIEFDTPMRENVTLTLKLDPAWIPVRMPAELAVANGAGSMASRWTMEDGLLRIQRTISLTATTVAPKDFEDFRALIRAWQDPAHTTVLLRRAE
jgi:hypothetical protein